MPVSIGADTGIGEEECQACQGVYRVLGNNPDPANVSVETGLVRYDLVARDYVDDLRIATYNIDSRVVAALQVQLIDDRTLRFELVRGSPTA